MFIDPPPPSDDTRRIIEGTAREMGFEMNLTQAWAWRPDVYEGFAALRGRLTSASSLSMREQAVIVCATAAQLGDAYCALAWGRKLAGEAGAPAAAEVIEGGGDASLTARDTALAAWVRKLVQDPNGTTAADVQQLRDAGFSEREIFEATVFAAFRLAFSSVNDALGVQPDAQLRQGLAPELAQAVSFGRAPAGTAGAVAGAAAQ